MDTGSKKFNFLAVKKFIAVLLCMLSVGISVSHTVSTLISVDKKGIGYSAFADALSYDPAENKIWETKTFKDSVNGYINYLSSMIGDYGEGTEESYKIWSTGIEKYNESAWKKARGNLVKYLQSTNMCYDYLVAEWDGIVTTLGNVGSADLSSEKRYYYIESTVEAEDIDYYRITDDDFASGQSITVYKEIKEAAAEMGADGIVKLDYNCVVTTDYDYEETVKEYKTGYYAFKINDSVLKRYLYSHNVLKSDYSGGYEQFRQNYERLNKSVQQFYDTGRYFIMDSEGKTYTNMKNLSEKSTKEEIVSEFQKLGFFCYEAPSGNMCLADSSIYTFFTVRDYNYDTRVYYSEGEYDEYATTGYDFTVYSATTDTYPSMPVVTTTLPASIAESTTFTVDHMEYETSKPVVMPLSVAVKTTSADYDTDPFIADGDIVCFIGVDMNAEPASEDNRFTSTVTEIELASVIIRDSVITVGILVLQFLICFAYLLIKSGRRKGDKENVYLFKADKIFSEIRIAFDAGLGFLLFLLIIEISENMDSLMQTRKSETLVTVLYGVIAAALCLLVLDAVLFIVRHIKNRSFFKNLFVVWLILKPVKTAVAFIKKLFVKIRQLKERILYVKDLKKTVIIRTAIVAAINVLGALLGTALLYSYEPVGFFVFVALLIIDCFAVYRGLIFTAGTDKLFRVIQEMRNGNLDEEINKNALPEYLMLPAENLQGLGDGLKLAVEEAVRQEQTKTELITNVSHDLKTPLTSIINYVDLLKKCDITDETALSYLQVISEKSDRLKHLISDLVEASKASTGAISVNFVNVSLKELLNQMLGEFEEDFEKRGLNFILSIADEDLTVRADSKLLYRVMENLFVNVKKYALENSRVYVNLLKKDGKGIIEIKNISAAPLNISANELKSRFVRGDASRTTDGNGLGLSIAENLCVLQKGKLELEINGDLFVARVEMEEIA